MARVVGLLYHDDNMPKKFTALVDKISRKWHRFYAQSYRINLITHKRTTLSTSQFNHSQSYGINSNM